MRLSVAVQIASGAAAVSAAVLPNTSKRDQLVPFEYKFPTMSLDEFNAQVSSHNSSSSSSTTQGQTTTAAAEDGGGGGTVSTQAECASPFVRVEWRNMADADKLSFIKAIGCLWDAPAQGLAPPATNRYEELVWVHQQMTNTIHNAGIFLPWHRYYLWTFSRLLREECGYAAPLPWWNEVADSGNFAASGLFTDDYFGALPPINNGQGTCITNGEFGGRPLHIGPGSSNTERCLSRGEDTSVTSNVNQNFVNQCNSQGAYSDMEMCNERGPHGYGHNGLGPVMAEVSASPSDPVFFMHHSFVDHMWNQWQRSDASRFTAVGGCAAPGDNCSPMTASTTLSSMGLRPDVTVGDMLDIRGESLCYDYDS
ncbi:uncharacterized protein B0I36DRAFT_384684 [Microdochium trichocladiopsis]|uniref:Tyrosinase copper-binding domain-containing protein n=1 Tax=Microdochium trichocladiopsis TaxID=1682393 RepID=A0A9P9BLZ6_9PEZI|nr:uncharacterized protein B0I36DRAFT_384684 [Microdochium trichocladiopsis]KAH7029108.1 hypothetical protein B0I36DRAFT_384684 [Microdochium trichocladiopsis]